MWLPYSDSLVFLFCTRYSGRRLTKIAGPGRANQKRYLLRELKKCKGIKRSDPILAVMRHNPSLFFESFDPKKAAESTAAAVRGVDGPWKAPCRARF
jgi:hypothetical protein